MDEMKVKYLKGWLDPDIMLNNAGWLYEWHKTAQTAKDNNRELVVFSIPKINNGLSDGEMIRRIEKVINGERGFW